MVVTQLFNAFIAPVINTSVSFFLLILEIFCNFLFFVVDPYVKYLVVFVKKKNPDATPNEIEKIVLTYTFVVGVFSIGLAYFIATKIKHNFIL
jgi:hypothetical protein